MSEAKRDIGTVAEDVRVRFASLLEVIQEAKGLGVEVMWMANEQEGRMSGEWLTLGSMDLRAFAEPNAYKIVMRKTIEF